MSAREKILGRLASRLGEGRDAKARLDAVTARLRMAGAQTAPRPAAAEKEGEEGLAQFEAKLKGVDATVTHLAALSDLPEALSDELRRRNLPQAMRLGAEPDFAGLDWGGLEVSHGPGRIEEPATLSRAVAGVAETGTIALRSGPENPVTLTFLGETHFIVLKASEVVPGLEEMWRRVRASGEKPRTVNLVTGPSRSADIGQVLQLGAHGPVAVHVFVIDD